MKILITGITGFAGSHLADFCLDQKLEVHGTYRYRSPTKNIDHIHNKVHMHECDLTDYTATHKVIQSVLPDKIFHLAAQSYVKSSWDEPMHTLDNNIRSQVNLFEAVRHSSRPSGHFKLNYKPQILIAGSSEEYGNVPAGKMPIKETEHLNPLSPYAVSKVAQDLLGFQYHKSYGMHIVRTRAFNHTGPRRGDVFVCSSFAKQIVDIENGKQEKIKVGNLDAKRDFTDVRDVVRGYWMALALGEAGEVYNICSNETYSISDVLDRLITLSGTKVKVENDKDRMRPSDLEVLRGDNTKFRKKTGWKPSIPFNQTLKDLLEYHRNESK